MPDLQEIGFQCPSCGYDLRQTAGKLKSNCHMTCPGCGVGIEIDTGHGAATVPDSAPSDITIRFFQK